MASVTDSGRFSAPICPIPGYPGYDVSSFGRVRSYRTKIAIRGEGNRCGSRSAMATNPRILKGWPNGDGYTSIRAVGPNSRPMVHRLVAQAFLPNPERLPEVDHRNYVKSDARLDNLEWVTKAENIRRALASGVRDKNRPSGEAHYGAKASDAEILEMQRLYRDGVLCSEIAKRLNFNVSYVYQMAHARRGRGKKLKEKHDGSKCASARG